MGTEQWLRLLRSGNFAEASSLLRRHCKSAAGGAEKQTLRGIFHQITPVSLPMMKSKELKHRTDFRQAVISKRVFVLLDNNADWRAVSSYLEGAAFVDCLYEGKLVGGPPKFPNNTRAQRISDIRPIYDPLSNAPALRLSSRATKIFKRSIEDKFSVSHYVCWLAEYSKELSQSVDSFFAHSITSSAVVRDYIRKTEYDYFLFVHADSLLCSMTVPNILKYTDHSSVFFMRSLKKPNIDPYYFRNLSFYFVHYYKNASQNMFSTFCGIEKAKVDSEVSHFELAAQTNRIRRLVESALPTSMPRHAALLFPVNEQNTPISQGDYALIEEISKLKPCILYVPEAVNSKRERAIRNKYSEEERVRLVLVKETKEFRSALADLADGLAPLINELLADLSIERTRYFWKVRNNPIVSRQIILKIRDTVNNIIFAQALVNKSSPDFLVSYPPALPASRAISREVRRINGKNDRYSTILRDG